MYCDANGLSAIDYSIMPVALFCICKQFIVSNFKTYSDHACLHTELETNINDIINVNVDDNTINQERNRPPKYKWNEDMKPQVLECLRINSDRLTAMCNNINFKEQNVFDYSVNEYTNCLEELMSPFLKKATPKQARILKEESVSIAVKTINLGSTILVNSYINNMCYHRTFSIRTTSLSKTTANW